MKTLVVAEVLENHLASSCLNVLSAVQACSTAVDVLVVGADPSGAAEEAARLPGVERVRRVQSASPSAGGPEHVAMQAVAIGREYDLIVFAATAAGKATAPRVAALLDVPQVSDVIRVLSGDAFERPIFAGNAIEVIEVPAAPRVITVRSSAFARCVGTGSARIEALEEAAVSAAGQVVERKNAQSERPELGDARVVVSGGRALGSAEKFDMLLSPLADKLNAALGASRAAVDEGYAPNNLQVGQTGKIVAPELYVACGISGAIQHLAGMKDSKVIVAINRDPEAPIFQFADYGLVGDIFQEVPALVKQLGA